MRPPGEGYALYRHRNADAIPKEVWHGYYWARPNERGDYEIRSVPAALGEPSVPGGIMPAEGFERTYVRARREDGPS